MKSVDFRNDPMFLRNQFARDGTFEIPVIKRTKLDLDDIEFIGYDMPKYNLMAARYGQEYGMDLYSMAVSMKSPENGIQLLA